LKSEDLKKIVEAYAADEALLLTSFTGAWTKLMTADRFAGPTENVCANVSHKTKEAEEAATSMGLLGRILAFLGSLLRFFKFW